MASSDNPVSSQLGHDTDSDQRTINGKNREYYHPVDSGSSSSSPSRLQAQHLENQKAAYWGYGPLARIDTTGERLPAFGGDYQPGLYKPPNRNIANPAPLGLAGFALTTFVLSLVNLNTRGVSTPSIVIAPAFAYGGLCQLLAGMWEFAANNTFGATALASYGSFWISLAIILTPGGFDIAETYGGQNHGFYTAFGFYIIAWFIFTFIIWLMTIRSTVAFSALILFVWLTFLCLGIGYIDNTSINDTTATPNAKLVKAGGVFGIIAAFLAWWNMLAGLADKSNSFFLVPVLRFPWSEEGRAARKARDEEKQA